MCDGNLIPYGCMDPILTEYFIDGAFLSSSEQSSITTNKF